MSSQLQLVFPDMAAHKVGHKSSFSPPSSPTYAHKLKPRKEIKYIMTTK